MVPAFLKLADERCNARDLLGLWYSRKNMAKPQLQIGLHQNFQDEMVFLGMCRVQTCTRSVFYLLARVCDVHWLFAQIRRWRSAR